MSPLGFSGATERGIAAALATVHQQFCGQKIVPLYESYYEEVLAPRQT